MVLFEVDVGEITDEAASVLREEYVANAATPPASPVSGAGAGWAMS